MIFPFSSDGFFIFVVAQIDVTYNIFVFLLRISYFPFSNSTYNYFRNKTNKRKTIQQ